MSDEEVATRAPESDLAEGSAVPGDSTVDQGPSLGAGQETAHEPGASKEATSGQTPTGEISKFNDIEAYVTKPADYPHAPAKLLLFLTGGTGIHATANKLQADAYAAQGYLVIMPDQFAGDAAPNNILPSAPETSFLETLKLRAAEVAKSFRLDMWLARHTPATVLPRLYKVLDAVKDEFADAVQAGDGVYAVGVSVGGKNALLLGSELGADVVAGQQDVGAEAQGKAEEGMLRKGPAVKAVVVAHGATIEREDFANVKVPVGLICVEDDGLFTDEVKDAGVKTLKDNKIEVETWVYPGVPHGFAILGEYQDETIKQAQKQAFDVILGWLKTH